MTDTTKLTIRLPAEDVRFVKSYAKDHGTTVTALFDRYLRNMQRHANYSPSTEVRRITGLIPADIDVVAEYHESRRAKHSR